MKAYTVFNFIIADILIAFKCFTKNALLRWNGEVFKEQELLCQPVVAEKATGSWLTARRSVIIMKIQGMNT